MALKLEFYLNNKPIKEPLNYQELSVELNFDVDDPDFRGYVSTNQWQFGLGTTDNQDAANIIKNYLTSSYGAFEGLPFKIKLNNDNDVQTLFDGYLDLSTGEYLCDEIRANSAESKSIDWLNEVAASVSYPLLYGTKITQKDFVYIPYLEYKPGDKLQAAIIVLTIASITFQLWTFIRQIVAFVKSVIASGGWGWEMIPAIVEMLVALIQLLVNFFILKNQIFRYLFNPIKYKAGMYLLDLCIKGAAELGYTFDSSILTGRDSRYKLQVGNKQIGFNNVVCIPESFNQYENSEDGNLGIDNIALGSELKGVYRGTFKDLLLELKTMFNGKIIIDQENKILRLERRDYSIVNDLYQVPKIDRDNTPYRFNADDLISNYEILFTRDDQDKVSLQNYQGTELKVITVPLITNGNFLMKGDLVNSISFGLTTLKTELTKQEKFIRGVAITWIGVVNIPILILRAIINGINKLIKAINKILKVLKSLGAFKKPIKIRPIKISAIPNPIQDFKDRFDNQRLNVLLFETDYLSTPKLVALDDDYFNFKATNGLKNNTVGYKPSANNRNLLSAEFLWERFHYINSFTFDTDAYTYDHNQYKIYTLQDIPFCIDDYNKIKNNPIIKDYDGKQGEMISVKWNVYQQKAEITFKIKEKYTNNIKLDKLFSDGR